MADNENGLENIALCEINSKSHVSEKTNLTNSQTEVDFEEAIKETGYGKFNYLLLLLAFPASCSTTYESTSFSFALPTASCDLKLNAFDRGYLNGTIYAGMIVSAFLWGFLSDKFGRQKVLAFGYLGDVIFTVCVSLSSNFWSILGFKFLSGIMISGPFSIFMSYLSEMFNSRHRDSVVLVVGFCQAIGGVIQPCLAWLIIPQNIKWSFFDGLISLNSWQLFLLVCAVPSLISGFSILLCHESPKFLLAMGREKEALRVFQSIYSTNSGKRHTYSVKRLKAETGANSRMKFWEQMTALFRPPYLYKAFLAFSIQFGGLSTLNTIRLWLPQLFFYIKESQSDSMTTCEVITGNHTLVKRVDCDNFKVDTSVYSNMIYSNILIAVAFAISIAIIKHTGKKKLFVTLFVIQSAVICSLGWLHPTITSFLAPIFVALAYNSSIGLLGFVVQIFPTTLKTMAVSLTMMFGRIGVVMGNILMPYAINLSCTGTFLGFSGITLVCGLLVLLLAATSSKKS
ncbi:synaptic vesicle glycoprotein 2B-like isoform X2 [Macrosteles quadrilineatus]|uniref:synaptic vesicle glycoprotein 2B-like isoform X2 n=1 Tax=Macrosteles quadrilineatus TaxID=74068 RepID=UPI0023E2C545|nr:synaptic vesicle glycoprotein 2B-like isoform X2 [Macrosteles quadrilineatus]